MYDEWNCFGFIQSAWVILGTWQLLYQQNHPNFRHRKYANGLPPSPAFDKKWPNLSKSRKLKDVKDMLWNVGFSTSFRTIHRYLTPVVGGVPNILRCEDVGCLLWPLPSQKIERQTSNTKMVTLGGWPTIRVWTVLFKKQPVTSAPTVHWGFSKSPSCKKRSQPGPRFLRSSTIHYWVFFWSKLLQSGRSSTNNTHLPGKNVSFSYKHKRLSDFVNQDRIDVDVCRISGSAKFPLS